MSAPQGEWARSPPTALPNVAFWVADGDGVNTAPNLKTPKPQNPAFMRGKFKFNNNLSL